MSQFGKFNNFCRDSTLPVCNLFDSFVFDSFAFDPFASDSFATKSCVLKGLEHAKIRNLGVIILAAIAILVSFLLLFMSEKKQAAVGRREMQIFLIGYILISIFEIFSIGGFLQNQRILTWFSAFHIGAITATFWVLLINAIIGYQLLDDGTILSIALTFGSALIVFIGTSYVALDTRFTWTKKFTTHAPAYRNYALYVLYLLFPIIAAAAYYILEAVLVLHVLEEKRPMVLLTASALLFAIGQVFNFVISVHLCTATSGKIDGSLFQTFFNILAVVALWYYWSSITEDVWTDEPLNPGMTENFA